MLNYVESETAMNTARFVLYCGSLRSDLPKAIEDAVKIGTFVKREDEEICVICQHNWTTLGRIRCTRSMHI